MKLFWVMTSLAGIVVAVVVGGCVLTIESPQLKLNSGVSGSAKVGAFSYRSGDVAATATPVEVVPNPLPTPIS